MGGRKFNFKGLIAVIAVLIGSILLSGCSQVEKPTANVDEISVKTITPITIELDVRVTVNNPNPVGAHLTKVTYDVYCLKNKKLNYLGQGKKKDIDIRKRGNTTINIPTVVENKQAISAIVEMARKGSVPLKVSGSAHIDLKATTYELPFKRTKEITIPEEKLPRMISP